jgi:hypothetical protein
MLPPLLPDPEPDLGRLRALAMPPLLLPDTEPDLGRLQALAMLSLLPTDPEPELGRVPALAMLLLLLPDTEPELGRVPALAVLYSTSLLYHSQFYGRSSSSALPSHSTTPSSWARSGPAPCSSSNSALHDPSADPEPYLKWLRGSKTPAVIYLTPWLLLDSDVWRLQALSVLYLLSSTPQSRARSGTSSRLRWCSTSSLYYPLRENQIWCGSRLIHCSPRLRCSTVLPSYSISKSRAQDRL